MTQIQAPSWHLLMDWSLVLASQGIEAEMVEDESGYNILVREEDCDAARDAVRQFTKENACRRTAQFQPSVPLRLHPAVFVWVGLMVFLFVRQSNHPELRAFGVMDNLRFSRGDWWRPMTAMGLHQDVGHLLSNLTFGVIFLGLAMTAYGLWPALLLSFTSGALGNCLGWLVYPPNSESLGASGMVMAALGLLAAFAVCAGQRGDAPGAGSLRGAGAALLMLVLLGFAPSADVIAHVGGFIFGVIGGLIWLLTRSSPVWQEKWSGR